MLLCGIRGEREYAGSAAHWQRFRSWIEERGIESCDPNTLAMAYVAPPPFGGARAVEICVPVLSAPHLDAPDAVLRTLGGRFVLASGEATEVPGLIRAARAFASARGLPFERGSIEIYRPPQGGVMVRVEAGVRIHD